MNTGLQNVPRQSKRSMQLRRYGHAGGHLRDALVNAVEEDRARWYEHVRIDFTRDFPQTAVGGVLGGESV